MADAEGVLECLERELLSYADEGYRDFSAKLLPPEEQLIGVRLPVLRRLAKRLADSDWRAYLDEAEASEPKYFEDAMLHGMVIGCLYPRYADESEVLRRTRLFLPHIHNWSVCDSFCSGLKLALTLPNLVRPFLDECLSSSNAYTVRFGVVMLLKYYVTPWGVDGVLACMDKVNHVDYFVKMAVAWCVSICYIRFPEKTLDYLRHCMLDSFTYNKSIQKIIESRCVPESEKGMLRGMKRKEGER